MKSIMSAIVRAVFFICITVVICHAKSISLIQMVLLYLLPMFLEFIAIVAQMDKKEGGESK